MKKTSKAQKIVLLFGFFIIFTLSFWLLSYNSNYLMKSNFDQIQKTKNYIIKSVEVLKVYDGDTLTVRFIDTKRKVVKVRIRDIDCFEMKSDFTPSTIRAQKQGKYFNISLEEVYEKGKNAKNLLSAIVAEEDNKIWLVFKKYKKDVYNRLLAFVFIKKQNINESLINSGYCFKYIRL